MCHSALLWYLNPCFFSLRHYLVIHKEVLGCSVVFYSSKIFVLLRQSWACISRYFSPAPFAFQKKKTRFGTFATLVRVCAYWGREPHTASSGNVRDQTAIPTVNPWFWHVFSRCVCVLHWLNIFSLQVFHSLVYRVAMLTMSHLTFHRATS